MLAKSHHTQKGRRENMAEVIRVIPEGEPRKKNTLVIHIETDDANKKLDELIEKANQLKATLRECGIPADKL
jgi:hypothetical protein